MNTKLLSGQGVMLSPPAKKSFTQEQMLKALKHTRQSAKTSMSNISRVDLGREQMLDALQE